MAVSYPCFAGLLLLWALSAHNTAIAQPVARPEGARLEEVFTRIMAESGNSTALADLRECTQTIGHRMSGTPNGARAEAWMLEKCRALGLAPLKYQPFAIQTWLRQFVEFEVVPSNSDHFVKYEAVALAHSPREADVRAPLIDCGNGLAEDFERIGMAVNGKLALVNIGIDGPKAGRRNLHRSEKTALAIGHGAAGVVFINAAPGKTLLTGTASADGNLIPIPALCISQEAGKALRAWQAEGKPLQGTVRMENLFEERQARNVVATLPGKAGSKLVDEVIVVGAHLDSWDLATGATDNALGSFTILETARLLKKLAEQGLQTDRSIQIAFFMGEEQGLLGSEHFVQVAEKHKRLGRIKYMLNADMSGNAQGFNSFTMGKAGDYFAALGSIMAAQDSGYHNTNDARLELHSDHQSFLLRGIPVADPVASMPAAVYQCYHADCDRANLIEPDYINRTARALALAAYALATEPTLPAPIQTSEQTKQMLIKAGLKEKLVLGKDWRWD